MLSRCFTDFFLQFGDISTIVRYIIALLYLYLLISIDCAFSCKRIVTLPVRYDSIKYSSQTLFFTSVPNNSTHFLRWDCISYVYLWTIVFVCATWVYSHILRISIAYAQANSGRHTGLRMNCVVSNCTKTSHSLQKRNTFFVESNQTKIFPSIGICIDRAVAWYLYQRKKCIKNWCSKQKRVNCISFYRLYFTNFIFVLLIPLNDLVRKISNHLIICLDFKLE